MLRAYAFLLLLIAVGCTHTAPGAAPAARHPWTIPETLRLAMVANPKTLNPILSTQMIEAMAEAFVFDPLVATDPEGHDHPVLASVVPTLENGGISKDGLTITYHLRHNVRWHDNVPFSSRDVRFSISAIMNPNSAVSSRHGYDDIASVATPDAYTVIIHLKEPFAPAVHTFFAHSDTPFMVLPAHLLERYSSLDRVAFNSHPIGTGPFKFVKWVRGDRIEYVANDDYFLGKPKIRRIIVRIVPDENTEIALLRAHDIDWMFEASPHAYRELKTIPDIRLVLVAQNAYEGLAINTARPILADLRVRRAIAYALDKPRLLADFTAGSATLATEDLPTFLWAYEP